jgi:hypothetical protein
LLGDEKEKAKTSINVNNNISLAFSNDNPEQPQVFNIQDDAKGNY